MTRLADIPSDFYLKYYRQLPQIDVKEVRMLWHCAYWDGPLDGILLYQGKLHWFQIFYTLRTDEMQSRVDEENIAWNDYFVRYLIIELSEEQIKEEEYWHGLFRQKVGTHTDYDENGHRTIGALAPKDMWSEFYEAYKTRTPRDLSNNQIVGWFEYFWGSIRQDEDEDSR
ncbi:MAG TPA: hypothetical protein PKH77_13800 [Anaerolineae bacterium]|nr:hypothetical protein [Anaerolineae bacterium]